VCGVRSGKGKGRTWQIWASVGRARARSPELRRRRGVLHVVHPLMTARHLATRGTLLGGTCQGGAAEQPRGRGGRRGEHKGEGALLFWP